MFLVEVNEYLADAMSLMITYNVVIRIEDVGNKTFLKIEGVDEKEEQLAEAAFHLNWTTEGGFVCYMCAELGIEVCGHITFINPNDKNESGKQLYKIVLRGPGGNTVFPMLLNQVELDILVKLEVFSKEAAWEYKPDIYVEKLDLIEASDAATDLYICDICCKYEDGAHTRLINNEHGIRLCSSCEKILDNYKLLD
jgi:hypothetical protein